MADLDGRLFCTSGSGSAYGQEEKRLAGRGTAFGLNKLLEELPGEKSQGEARGAGARRSGSER